MISWFDPKSRSKKGVEPRFTRFKESAIDRLWRMSYLKGPMFELPKLPYSYDALEPYIDAQTMEIHYSKHHQTYVNNLNKALESHPELIDQPLEELIKNPDVKIRNQAGGVFNHNFFWKIMSPEKQEVPKKFAEFIEPFSAAALGIFGSGWCWLTSDLKIVTTPNQESIANPILGLDVWEHAYYLKYQNKRTDYVNAWWNVVNWKMVLFLNGGPEMAKNGDG